VIAGECDSHEKHGGSDPSSADFRWTMDDLRPLARSPAEE
jgi:hypothetical protein